MEQHQKPGLPLDKGADGRPAGLAHQPVTLPVTGDRAVLTLGRPLADADHAWNAAASLFRFPVWSTKRSSGPQTNSKLPAKSTSALHVDRLVGGLVGNTHLRLVGELALQLGGDLFWAPPSCEFGLDELVQDEVGG